MIDMVSLVDTDCSPSSTEDSINQILHLTSDEKGVEETNRSTISIVDDSAYSEGELRALDIILDIFQKRLSYIVEALLHATRVHVKDANSTFVFQITH
jgi:hypothetical protein